MIRIIVAVDDKNGIAKNGNIPWNNKDDLSFFKNITSMGKSAVVMGRKTMDTLPNKHLSGRDNYIITRSYLPNRVNIYDIKLLKSKYDSVWIIGGESVYKQCMDQCIAEEIYLSIIPGDYNCDKFFTVPNSYEQISTITNDTFIVKVYKCKLK